MSIIEIAETELDRAKFDPADKLVLLTILKLFFRQWDSGGAVWAMAPVLMRLIAGQPLTPLTGNDDEWMDRSDINDGDPLWQNIRAPSVFKNKERAWDNDGDKPQHQHITFPYDPVTKLPASPVVEL